MPSLEDKDLFFPVNDNLTSENEFSENSIINYINSVRDIYNNKNVIKDEYNDNILMINDEID